MIPDKSHEVFSLVAVLGELHYLLQVGNGSVPSQSYLLDVMRFFKQDSRIGILRGPEYRNISVSSAV